MYANSCQSLSDAIYNMYNVVLYNGEAWLMTIYYYLQQSCMYTKFDM